jgi:elongation factor P hydroxylase
MPRNMPALSGTAELNAMIERVAPDILALLADGVPRRKAAIVEALAGRHDTDDVVLALIRLTVTEKVVENGGKYTLAQEVAPDAG